MLAVVRSASCRAAVLLAAVLAAQAPPKQPDATPTQPPVQQQPPRLQLQLQPQAPRQDPQAPSAAAADAQVDAAKAALRGKDFAKALQLLLPLAKGGHAGAQALLGFVMQKGLGVAADPAAALRWYTLSALQGRSDARFTLGQMYYNGEGTAKDLTKAADLFLLGAAAGDADGQWALGMCLAAGEGRPKNVVEAMAWLLLAAQQGHPQAKKVLEGNQVDADTGNAARTAAATLQQLIEQKGFDPQKLPKVPVPDGMSLDPAAQPEPRSTAAPRIEGRMAIAAEILANGDLRGTATLSLQPAVYAEMKQLIPDPRLYLRDLKSSRNNQEIATDAKARYDDASSAVVIDLHLLGGVQNRGEGRWRWQTENHKFVALADDGEGRSVARFDFAVPPAEGGGLAITGQASYRLPAGARNGAWDGHDNALDYELPYAGPQGQGKLRVRFDVRDRVMSCLYKVYGMETGFAAQWVGKAVLTNAGDGPLTDVRVRFQFGDYSELDLWQKFPELVPGQTAVAVYRPVFRKQIAELTSTTPANVVVAWRWTDAQGKVHEDSDGGRVSILGRHEFVFSNLLESESTGSFFDAFSNSDLVAAWVTRDDPVVKQFASAANKAAGGAGAPYSDEAAWKVLKACYELWLANDFTYQGPTGLADASLSFDNKIVQSMKFPRDVIRDRSGTCIELSALYCAMAQACGLKSCMILIPGHAFPAVRLPGGGLLPVEATGIGGGKRGRTATFEQVVQAATENYKKHAASGDLINVDIPSCWLRGVSNPELEALPADILQRWGTVLEFTLTGDQQGNGGGGGGAKAFLGGWSGVAQQPLPTGGNVQWTMQLVIGLGDGGVYQVESAGEARVPNGYGGQDTYQFRQTLAGQLQNGTLSLRGTKKLVIVNGMSQQSPTDTMTLQLQDDHLVGEVRLPSGTVVTVDVQRSRQQ